MSELMHILALLCLLAASFLSFKVARKQMPWKNPALAFAGALVFGILGMATDSSGEGPEEGCLTVSEELATMLIEDLPGAALTHVYAVKSPDHGEVYYVSGQFKNPAAFGDAVESAVWATNDLQGQGLIFAVDGFARTGSNWGDGTKTSAALSSADAAAVKAQHCSDAAAR